MVVCMVGRGAARVYQRSRREASGAGPGERPIAARLASDYDSGVGRYRVEVHAAFEAAHHLLSYRGGMEPAHGHSWRVSVEIAASELDGEGMAFDFVAARHALLDLAGLLDHRDINTVPPFDTSSPTTERLAKWFFERMRERLPTAGIRSATVWEGPHCSATYLPDADADVEGGR